MIWWKVFTDQFDEHSPDNGFNGLAVCYVFFYFCFDCYLLVVDVVAWFYIHCLLGIFDSKWLTPKKYF